MSASFITGTSYLYFNRYHYFKRYHVKQDVVAVAVDGRSSLARCRVVVSSVGNRSEGVQPYAASGSGALSVVGCTGGSSDGDDVPER